MTLRSAHGEVRTGQRCGQRLGQPVDSVLRGWVVKGLLVLVVLLSGCGSVGASAPLASDSVALLTGVDPVHGNSASDGSGCYLDWTLGLLSVDPTYGTKVKDEGGDPPGQVAVVMWKPGYTARRVGSEISVVDPNGTVVATTGHRYKIAGGFVGPNPPAIPLRVFWACNYVVAVP
jgi:hypothetical protein